LKVKDVINQLEYIFGRQNERYVKRLINDALLDISSKRQHRVDTMDKNLAQDQRWYDLGERVIDIIRVEVKDSDDRYAMIPRLVDSHKLLKGDDD
jgi:hypothetical protein